MRKLILIPMVAIFVAIVLMVSCKPSAKEEQAQEKVNEAKVELAIAKEEANQEEWQNFKNDMDATIDRNDARIEELKLEMKNSGESANTEYNRRINVLRDKNDTLKVRMKSYKNDANSDWKSFKSEFNHDMDELGKALKDFTVKNKK